MFTVFPIIIKRNLLNRLFCYNTDILHYHWLSHFPVACQRLVVSDFIVICCKTFAMVLCFYGDHITHAKLWKMQFPQSLVELELIIILFTTKEGSWYKIFQTDAAPC